MAERERIRVRLFAWVVLAASSFGCGGDDANAPAAPLQSSDAAPTTSGTKVSFVGEVETDIGALVKGTFVIAKKKDGKTNSHTPADAPIVMASGEIEFLGDSAFQPMNPDKSIMDCTDYPFSSRYVFSRDLKTLTCASSTNCKSAAPCPN